MDLGGWVKAVKSKAAIWARICLINDCALRTVRKQHDNWKTIKKGQSGNPGGRPKVVAEVKELARAHTGEAIETLVSIMTNPKSAPAARVSAANALLDRGYGKPPQHITGEGGPSYVVRLPEPCKTADEWVASLGDRSHKRRAVQWLNRVSRQCITKSLLLTARLTEASVVSINWGGRHGRQRSRSGCH